MRMGREGLMVGFRVQGSGENAWEEPMEMLPQPGDRIIHVDLEETQVSYNVVKTVFGFTSQQGSAIVDGQGNIIGYAESDKHEVDVIVLMTEV